LRALLSGRYPVPALFSSPLLPPALQACLSCLPYSMSSRPSLPAFHPYQAYLGLLMSGCRGAGTWRFALRHFGGCMDGRAGERRAANDGGGTNGGAEMPGRVWEAERTARYLPSPRPYTFGALAIFAHCTLPALARMTPGWRLRRHPTETAFAKVHQTAAPVCYSRSVLVCSVCALLLFSVAHLIHTARKISIFFSCATFFTSVFALLRSSAAKRTAGTALISGLDLQLFLVHGPLYISSHICQFRHERRAL